MRTTLSCDATHALPRQTQDLWAPEHAMRACAPTDLESERSVQQVDLTGQVAVVTGGRRGLGRAVAEASAEVGADVVIASRKHDALHCAPDWLTTGRATHRDIRCQYVLTSAVALSYN